MRGNRFIDLRGQRYGRLLVLSLTRVKRPPTIWKCRCDCGKVTRVRGGCLGSGQTRSCGCLKRRPSVLRLRPYESRYNALVGRCRVIDRKVMSFRSYLTFTKTKDCYYCGENVSWVAYGKRVGGSNLDRIDSRLGYLKRNCVVCCGTCNRMKLAMTQAEFFAKIAQILRRNNAR